MRVGHCAGCLNPRGESVEAPSSSGRRQWFRLVLRSIHDDIPADSACSRWARDPREHTRWGFWISRMPMAPAYFGRRELGPFGIRAHKALSPSALKRTSMQRSARKPGGVLAPTCSVPKGASAACDAVPASLARAICHHPADRYERRERGRTCASRRSL